MFKGSLLPETILSVKGSDSLPAPKSSLAFVSSVGSPGLVWDLLSSLNVLFLIGIKLVASFSSDSAQEIQTFNFIVRRFLLSWLTQRCVLFLVGQKKNESPAVSFRALCGKQDTPSTDRM